MSDTKSSLDDPFLELMDQIAKSGCDHDVSKMCKMCVGDDIKKDNNQRPPPMANPTWVTGVAVPSGNAADNAKDSPMKLGPRGGKYEINDGKKEYVKSVLTEASALIKKANDYVPVATEPVVEKALNTRSLVITPAMVRNMDVFRSATTQTSRMYTGLAQPVRDTLDYLAVQNGPATQAQDAAEKRTAQIEELRRNLTASGHVPKEDIGPNNVGNHRK